MTNGLAVYKEFDNMVRAAVELHASGYFTDAKSKAQAITKVLAGAELGLPPFASMSGIHIIQGKPALGSNIIATLVKNDPRYDYRVRKSDSGECTLEWFENGQSVGTAGFTIDEAKTAQLTKNPTWTKYPSDMLFARAISRGARRFAPGVFGGSPVYTPEELGADEDVDGRIIDITPSEVVDVAPVVFDEPVPANEPKTFMGLDTANNVTGSDGVKYGDKETDTLTHMWNTIKRCMDDPSKAEKLEEYQMKSDAIQTILNDRNK